MHRLIIVLISSLSVLVGCKRPADELPRPDLAGRTARVLTTTGMVADAVRVIGQNHVEVDCLMGPGVDPHLYVPSPKDLARIEGADLVLYNGLHLEGKMTDLLEDRARRARTVPVAEGLPGLLPTEEGNDGTHDPHVWFDVTLWMKVIERVREALIELDPAHETDYRTNTDAYLRELASLDREVRARLATIPESQRVLITAHDAFGYFGRAYGVEVRGLQGVSTATDTSGRDVQDLADLIGSRKIRAVFAESSVPDKGMRAVQAAVAAKYKGFEVNLVDVPLYSDALGPPDSPAGTYIGMVRHNVDAIVRALGG